MLAEEVLGMRKDPADQMYANSIAHGKYLSPAMLAVTSEEAILTVAGIARLCDSCTNGLLALYAANQQHLNAVFRVQRETLIGKLVTQDYLPPFEIQ